MEDSRLVPQKRTIGLKFLVAYLKNATTLTLYVSGGRSKKNLLVYIKTLSSVESKKIFPAGFLVLAIVDPKKPARLKFRKW